MAETQTGTDLRKLRSQGKIEAPPRILDDQTALRFWREGKAVTVHRSLPRQPEDKYDYWNAVIEVDGVSYAWSAPYNPTYRDELMEYMAINADSAPFHGLQFANLDGSGEAAWLYLVIAE